MIFMIMIDAKRLYISKLVFQPAKDGTTALMVAAYQSAKNWYPVTLVKTLIKKGKADVNKESNCCRDKRRKCCWSPLMAAAFHGMRYQKTYKIVYIYNKKY